MAGAEDRQARALEGILGQLVMLNGQLKRMYVPKGFEMSLDKPDPAMREVFPAGAGGQIVKTTSVYYDNNSAMSFTGLVDVPDGPPRYVEGVIQAVK